MEPERLLLENLDLLKRIVSSACARRQIFGSDADDMLGEVTLHLIRDDYHALRSWRGQARLSTYLTVVAQRVIADYGRHQPGGRWRPSEEARRLGPAAIDIERLRDRRRLSWEETFREITLLRKYQLSRAEFESIACRLPARVTPRVEGEAGLENESDDATPELEAIAKEHDRDLGRAIGVLMRLVDTLEPEDRFILNMLYWSGVTVAALARMLGADQKALYRRRDRLLSRLQADLSVAGIEPWAFAAVLGKSPWPAHRDGRNMQAGGNPELAAVKTGEASMTESVSGGRGPRGEHE